MPDRKREPTVRATSGRTPARSGGPRTIAFHLYTSCEGSIWVDGFSIRTIDANAVTAEAAGPRTPAVIDQLAEAIVALHKALNR